MARRISEVPGYSKRMPQQIKLEEYQNVLMEVQEVTIIEGDRNDFCAFIVQFPDNPGYFNFVAGGVFLVDLFRDVVSQQLLPIECCFYRDGSMWRVVDSPSDVPETVLPSTTPKRNNRRRGTQVDPF